MAWAEYEPPIADLYSFVEYMKTFPEFKKEDQDWIEAHFYEEENIPFEYFQGVSNTGNDLSLALGASGGFAVGKYGIA